MKSLRKTEIILFILKEKIYVLWEIKLQQRGKTHKNKTQDSDNISLSFKLLIIFNGLKQFSCIASVSVFIQTFFYDYSLRNFEGERLEKMTSRSFLRCFKGQG